MEVYRPPLMLKASTDCISGRTRDDLYNSALAESEREAVADLLNYLENVRRPIPLVWSMLMPDIAKRIRLLWRRTPQSPQYPCLLR